MKRVASRKAGEAERPETRPEGFGASGGKTAPIGGRRREACTAIVFSGVASLCGDIVPERARSVSWQYLYLLGAVTALAIGRAHERSGLATLHSVPLLAVGMVLRGAAVGFLVANRSGRSRCSPDEARVCSTGVPGAEKRDGSRRCSGKADPDGLPGMSRSIRQVSWMVKDSRRPEDTTEGD